MKAKLFNRLIQYLLLDQASISVKSQPENLAQISQEYQPLQILVNLMCTNHKSHMAYGVNGGCPSTHPIGIPEISLNISWTIPATGFNFRLSSDNYSTSIPGGHLAHADWWNGWDPATATKFLVNCVSGSKDCHSNLLGNGEGLD